MFAIVSDTLFNFFSLWFPGLRNSFLTGASDHVFTRSYTKRLFIPGSPKHDLQDLNFLRT